jgi:hypothetical protein
MSARNKLLLIGAICLAPLVLGTLAWYFKLDVGAPGNYGELLSPRLLSGPPFDRLRGKWLLITIDGAACDARCERKLYYLRQLRRALGKDMDRVERLWLLTDDARPRTELLQAVEGTVIERARRMSDFPGEATDHIYVVDPLGNLMMRYPRDPDPSRMLKDLQRLMKFARSA